MLIDFEVAMPLEGSPLSYCMKWRLCGGLVFIFLVYCSNIVSGHIRYSIPEEMRKESLIGNVAQDLGIDLKRLRAGRARIVTG